MRHTAPSARRAGSAFLLGMLVLCGMMAERAYAQRPFRVYDPFYRSETARRSFFDGYAFTTELSYRPTGSLQNGRQIGGPDYLGLSFRLDYEFATNLDLGAIIDAAGGASGRSLALSWVALKYYRTVENTDYAVRLAVDPSLDGRVGFSQMDLAFISTSLLSPILSSDYAIGVRRVRRGYEQFLPAGAETPAVPAAPSSGDFIYTRALGWEVHFMMQYSLILNPARSNVFVSLLVHRGQYDLLETSLKGATPAMRRLALENAGSISHENDGALEAGTPFTKEYRGGVVWWRAGVEYNRPGYQIMPFFSVPLKQWMPEESGSKSRVSAGVRFMLR